MQSKKKTNLLLFTMKPLSLVYLILFFGTQYALGKPFENILKCGYESCPKIDANKLSVHIVPHSHDDVGWLKTVDQYYYGSKIRNYGRRDGVIYIIDSVIRALKQNPQRKFIQVETAFLNKWWQQQSEARKSELRTLIQNGQFEIIGGAWSMNDEAAVHYQSVIDQFTLGLRLLNDTFGTCARPKIGWQIDPFGHTREMASIFAGLGYDGLFFSRLDWREKSERLLSKTGEIIWRGSASLGEESNLFTSVLYNHYSAPAGFCFDVLCSDEPIIDDSESVEFNQKKKVQDFAEFVHKQADKYKTNNIIITMGDDFNYQDALSYYHNLDKLIEGFTLFPQTYENKTINLFYSTPSCYLKAVNDEATKNGLDFAVKRDDFIPYATDPHTYWSGYYTSRPTSKRYERQGNNMLQVVKQLTSFYGDFESTKPLSEAMGIMQHHDAITGTEKQHVADDYHRILSNALEHSSNVANKMILKLLTKGSESANVEFKSCLLANVTYCDESQGKNFSVAIYNPLSRSISHYVRLPVNSKEFDITSPDGKLIKYQITPVIDHFNFIPDIKPAMFELVFKTENIPALGVQIYTVIEKNSTNVSPVPEDTKTPYTLGNELLGVELDKTTGFLSSMRINGSTIDVDQEYLYYISAYGDNSAFINRSSGAYIFRPSPENNKTQTVTTKVQLKTYKGDLVDEAHQIYNDWIRQIIRVYKGENHVEFDWLVGPINIKEREGKEVISRFTTKLDNKDIFYTDSNGREMIKRKRDFRATWNYTNEEPISGNYYPITSRIVLRDTTKGTDFAILNDRSQGGSSLKSGQVEIMVHRRCLHDDAFGVGESLNETQFGRGLVARGQHYVTFGETKNGAAAVQRDIAQRKILAPWVLISDAKFSEINKLNKEFKGISDTLPQNVQILTLESVAKNKILLRLEHVFEKDEDNELSKPVAVNIQGLFTKFEVVTLKETTLGGNQWKDENSRLKWKEGKDLGSEIYETPFTKSAGDVFDNIANFEIKLNPMQIRTFILDVKY